MIVVFRLQRSSCIDGFLTNFHSLIQSIKMLLVSFRSKVFYYSHSPLNGLVQSILGILSSQGFCCQHILCSLNLHIQSRLGSRHVIGTQISNLEIIEDSPCGIPCNTGHLYPDTKLPVFTHIARQSVEVIIRIGFKYSIRRSCSVTRILTGQACIPCDFIHVICQFLILREVHHMVKRR